MLLLFFTLSAFVSNAQLDIARLEVSNIPKGGPAEFSYNRVRAMFNVPIKIKDENYLFAGLDYSLIDIIPIDNLNFETENLKDFQLFEVNLGYTFKWKNNWRIIANLKPGVTSNSVKDLKVFKEVKLSGGLLFYKDMKKEKGYTLLLGAAYSAYRGVSFPLPIIKYHKIINERWSYDVGVPKMNLEYTFNEKHAIKVYAAFDGFSSEMQKTIEVLNSTVEKVNVTILLAGLKYDYTFMKNIEWYATAGYIFDSTIKLKTGNRDTVIKLVNENNLYLRTGIRIKI